MTSKEFYLWFFYPGLILIDKLPVQKKSLQWKIRFILETIRILVGEKSNYKYSHGQQHNAKQIYTVFIKIWSVLFIIKNKHVYFYNLINVKIPPGRATENQALMWDL